jgi:hypothetical protein
MQPAFYPASFHFVHPLPQLQGNQAEDYEKPVFKSVVLPFNIVLQSYPSPQKPIHNLPVRQIYNRRS